MVMSLYLVAGSQTKFPSARAACALNHQLPLWLLTCTLPAAAGHFFFSLEQKISNLSGQQNHLWDSRNESFCGATESWIREGNPGKDLYPMPASSANYFF